MGILFQHPLIKTSQDFRRILLRLQAELAKNPETYKKLYETLIIELSQLRTLIPEEYRDADLKKGE